MATSEVPEEGEQKREEAGEDESGEHEVDGSGKESKRGQKIGGFFKSMLKGRGKKDKGKKGEKEEEEVSFFSFLRNLLFFYCELSRFLPIN